MRRRHLVSRETKMAAQSRRRVRILLIVGTDSGDRGHPWRGNILVVVILSTGGHDGSTLGAVPGSR